MNRRWGRRGNPRDHRVLLLVGGVGALLLVWIVLVVVVGGGQASNQEAGEPAATMPDPAVEEPEEGTGGTGGADGTGGSTADASEGRSSEGRSTEGESSAAGPETAGSPDADPYLGKPEGYGQSTPKAAAASFITAAYGYSGSDPNEYGYGVGETVIWPDFYYSPGADEIQRYTDEVAGPGAEHAASMTDFVAEEASEGEGGAETVTGYAYFVVGQSYSSGDIEGPSERYRQRLTLVHQEGGFLVKVAETIEGAS